MPIDRRTLPAAAEILRWRAGDGWELRIMEWPQGNSAPRRGTLAFAGGRGDFIEKYIEAFGHWHAAGWQVMAFDWRGQGGSAGNIVGGHLASFDPLVADGAALLAHWAGAHDGPHVAIGHSMGGHLLLRILAEQRPRLAAAVLVAPMLGINAAPLPMWLGPAAARGAAMLGPRRPIWRERASASPMARIRQANLTSSLERYEDEQYWKGREPGFNLGPPSWGWMAAAYRSVARHTPVALARVTTPVLVLGTEADRLVSVAAIRRAAAALPDAELHLYPAAAHELLRESDPVRLDALARIDRFLDARAPA